MALWYPKASRSAIAPVDGGSFVGGGRKGLFHTTEGSTAAGAISSYRQAGFWPSFTASFEGGTFRIWQHIPLNRAARALVNAPGGVETNRDDVVQIELVGFAAHPPSAPGYLAGIAEWMRWVEANFGVPRRSTVRFEAYPASYGANNGVRLSGSAWTSYSGWCFPRDVLVLCRSGLKQIAAVQVGDEVLSHRGRWCKVVANARREAPETLRLRGQGHPGLVTTPEHPFWSIDSHMKRKRRTEGSEVHSWHRVYGVQRWREAREMAGQFWASPCSFPEIEIPEIVLPAEARKPKGPAPRKVELSPELMWLVGRWLGDGWLAENRTVCICGRQEEADEVREGFSAAGLVPNQWRLRAGVVAFKVSSAALTWWLRENFGEHAHGKTIPAWALGMNEKWRERLLAGYLSADGHWPIVSSGRTFESNTVSKALAIGIKMLAQTLGYRTCLYRRPAAEAMFEGRPSVTRDQWVVKGASAFVWHVQSHIADDLLFGRVREVLACPPAEVFNLTVAGDNSFIADGLVVHNCGHMHVPENEHGDPGALDVAALLQGDDDMPFTKADLESAAYAGAKRALNEGTGSGQTSWARTERAILGTVQTLVNLLNQVHGDLGHKSDEILAALTAAPTVALPEATKQQVAETIASHIQGLDPEQVLAALHAGS